MADIRLKTFPYEYQGRTYKLACNFNVLADLETQFGSVIKMLNRAGAMDVTRAALAFMMNEYADQQVDQQEWGERFTPRGIGRALGCKPADIDVIAGPIFDLIIDAVQAEKTTEDAGKN